MSCNATNQNLITRRSILTGLASAATVSQIAIGQTPKTPKRLLYVATPGIRNYLEYGGHGLVVLDIDNGHKFVKRIPLAGLNPDGKPDNIKGVCANARLGRIFVRRWLIPTQYDHSNPPPPGARLAM